MKEIVILGKTFGFLGWKKSPRSFYCGADDDLPCVVELIPALPEGVIDLLNPDHVNADPKDIQPSLLLPPPPYLGPDEILDGWRKIYVETQNVRRPFLTVDDDEPLQKELDAYKADRRVVYERQLKLAWEKEDHVERYRAMGELRFKFEAPVTSIKDPYKLEFKAARAIADPAKRVRAIARVRVRYEGSEYLAEDPPYFLEDQPAAGILNTNLEMVKAGAFGLRDNYLARQWAQMEGVNLDEMTRHRMEFFGWLNKWGIREKRGPHGQGFVPMFRSRTDPRFLECCARVRFRCEFADGSIAYLTDYKQMTPTLEESQALQKLLKANGSKGRGSRKLSRQRSNAGSEKAQIKDPDDKKVIMREIHNRIEVEGKGQKEALKEVGDIIRDGRSCWDLSQDYDVSSETLRHMYRKRKDSKKKK